MPRWIVPALVLCLFACSSDDPSPSSESPPFALERDDAEVVVTSFYRACASDEDCALVNVTCNGCCTRDAISASRVDTFEYERGRACASYRGAICDCDTKPADARCMAQRCVLIPRE